MYSLTSSKHYTIHALTAAFRRCAHSAADVLIRSSHYIAPDDVAQRRTRRMPNCRPSDEVQRDAAAGAHSDQFDNNCNDTPRGRMTRPSEVKKCRNSIISNPAHEFAHAYEVESG